MLEGGAFTQCWLRQGAGRECENASGPFNFRGCGLTAECLPARERVRVRFPAAAPIPSRLRVSTRPSLQNSAHSGRHGGSLPFSGSWQTSNALALQASLCGSVTHRLHQFQLRETRPMHREKPHKLLQVGVTPTPVTKFKGKRSGCWSVKPVSQKKVGSDEWSITTASHHFGLVAQLAEQPVVCGKAEGASPFGSAIVFGV